MIRTYLWKHGEPHATPLSGLPDSRPDGDTVVWVDLIDPTPDEEARVFEVFLPIHPLTLEDVTRSRRLPGRGAHLPKVEEFEDYLFVVANPLPPLKAGSNGTLRRNFAAKARPQLSGIVTPSILVTHHYDALPCVDAVWSYASRHTGCLGRGPDFLFHLILDGVVDEYAPVVESIAKHLDRVEGQLFKGPARDQLARLLKLKRRVSYLRKTLILEREVLARLTRGEFNLVEDREIVYYRNVYDHLVRYAELIENAREMVSDLLQTHLAAASNRLNEVMKLLTMFSAIVLPMSLIAGIYGMNFEIMPELKWDWGYPFSLALMALTGIAGILYFRRKGWL